MKKLVIFSLVLFLVFSLNLSSEAIGLDDSRLGEQFLKMRLQEIKGNKVLELRDLSKKYNWNLDYHQKTKIVSILAKKGECNFDITEGTINKETAFVLKDGKNYIKIKFINQLLSKLNERKINLLTGLRLENKVLTPGESFIAWIEIYNLSEKSITLNFSSGQLYDLYLKNSDHEIWRWSENKFFTMAVQSKKIAPGDKLIYKIEVPGIDGPGEYILSGEIKSQTSLTLPEITVKVLR